ncbi:MAG: hypothetical protein HY043_04050 [Verrucomicrobia bacterium]|nr:hypothetical protein [Verrucomicrobiota bacterium]
MQPLPPIPTPPSQRWREFRVQAVPVIVFIVALGMVFAAWRRYVVPATLIGEVEVVRENLASPKPGILARLNASHFQPVKKGDPVGLVIITDPKILASSLAVIQAEIELLRVGMSPMLAQQRNAINYDRLRVEWMSERVKLATARVNLQLAESELQRNTELFNDKIISDRLLEETRSKRDRVLAEVTELGKLVEEQEKNVQQLELSEGVERGQLPRDSLRASIAVQEQKLRLTEAELSPLTLNIPMDGVVSALFRRAGETIMAGEPILTVSAQNSTRIVGFVRQPLSIEPKPGMSVEVRTRAVPRQASLAAIAQVGVQMEPISPALRSIAHSPLAESGLPVSINVPADLKLRPGEIVDVILQPGRNP